MPEYLFFVILTELVSKLVCQGALHVVAVCFKTVSRINAGLQLQQGNTTANEDMQNEATVGDGLLPHKPSYEGKSCVLAPASSAYHQGVTKHIDQIWH